ncbi:MAG TPA: hypothetical protein VNN10_06000 [Dehalococcoidia bacterium]|nr:hypothetical protein [Dehalococcoidia bacterium]
MKALGDEVLAEVERFVRRHEAAQNALVLEHVASASEGLGAGPLCAAVGQALGVGGELSRGVALAVALTEVASAALRSLDPEAERGGGQVQAKHGLPLALNSADALFGLAHVALSEIESSEGGRRPGLAAAFDTLALGVWEALAAGDARGALGRMAGELAGRAAGKDEATVAALGRFGAAVSEAAAGETSRLGSARAALEGTNLSQGEREALSALLR